MTPHQKHPCELTRRMAEDIVIRSLAQSTIVACTYHVRSVTTVSSQRMLTK
ncbi:hypothetical protein K227x_16870 [Rubripirellula lacrimiformis]|uniref:Uncharacterized protein n=1 Tax=Rubripirellula lacrimiformis TaxID=1930273 RepID=A0A517N835_9BACT|nr:hypothetical protein [Rubripirellula lacrimiformis]QDT03305.1 hypothetical protein K227x_16870 [Rubripirellula lacrimiformis]